MSVDKSVRTFSNSTRFSPMALACSDSMSLLLSAAAFSNSVLSSNLYRAAPARCSSRSLSNRMCSLWQRHTPRSASESSSLVTSAVCSAMPLRRIASLSICASFTQVPRPEQVASVGSSASNMSNSLAHRNCCVLMASFSGVAPFWSRASISAPRPHKSLTTAAEPADAATCRERLPVISLISADVPQSSISCTTSTWSLSQAQKMQSMALPPSGFTPEVD
mmetsp:Transcript_85532/g.215588  ORF Transcript_85532/g.215588 Transcript_85532/m.215588 type:complete len:221 (-) Transcript_85532:97-759(-)